MYYIVLHYKVHISNLQKTLEKMLLVYIEIMEGVINNNLKLNDIYKF